LAVLAAVPADLVVKNATIITVDRQHPRAHALAVTAGRFSFVGDQLDASVEIGPRTTVIDASGQTVTPGFIDAHAHPGPVYPADSLWAAVDCRPAAIRTIDDLVAALKAKADRTPPGDWVTGTGYENLKLGRQPTRYDLDRASTRHPIMIGHYSGHESVCNSLALQLAKVTRDRPDPAGGRFVRDEQGEPNGRLEEGAASIVRAARVGRAAPPAAEVRAAYTRGFERFLSRGVTTVGVAGATVAHARTLEAARTEAAPLRLFIMMSEGASAEAGARQSALVPGEAGVRYGAVKVFHGGSVSAHTCWVSEPYVGVDGHPQGLKPARSQERLDALILSLHRAGLQACVHCNGDREIDMVVTAFERALAAYPRADHRHRLEHCSVVTPELLRRIKATGLVVVSHSYLWEHGDIFEHYQPRQWDTLIPAKSLLEAGISWAGHSDSPVSTSDPLLHIQALVTRTSAEGKVYGAAQRVTAEQAITTWTLGGAYACRMEDQTGSIVVGKRADFVVLGADPTVVPPDQIRAIPVRGTFVDGRRVFGAR
jgi:predicted amidohydrolase YtcJ